ncbi:hypothetical protein C3B55_00068 [Candidatus Pseudomonas adelgestsugas]|uniref:Uncharacterized protein n=2 Tax=Candidatus Pseudomonas adelgestsugas TaxID=1302376 RepID=A0ABX5R7L8_9PSED|nr:hypothetical protein C3B55_00068 [Candidatus Pseudomonas adelgestsugas]
MAAECLNRLLIGKFNMMFMKVKLVWQGARKEPFNLDYAVYHSELLLLADIGEERYAAFFGVLIIHYLSVVGA